MNRAGRTLAVVCVTTLAVAFAAGASSAASSWASRASTANPPRNPYLAASAVAIGHVDSAQTTGTPITGPTGPTKTLSASQLSYQHLGPGHFGIAISPKYSDGHRVIWSNGGDRIDKLDYDTLEVLDEFPLAGKTLQTAAQADADIATLDAQHGTALATTGLTFAAQYLTGLAGVYYALDKDNTLYVGGADSIIAYGDNGRDRESPIVVKHEWSRPAGIGGNFVGVNMTFDGRLVLVTDEGWVVVVTRDFSHFDAIQLPGAEVAPAHNQAVRAAGSRPGAADWVRNSLATDPAGGIYVASLDHMNKVVWTGKRLSNDAADGAWSEPYLNGDGNGTGATPALMGFGTDDRFVVITDGQPLMNVVLFWRDKIPADWKQLPGTPSGRIAGQLPADMGNPALTSIQTEQSVVVGGFGGLVVNNDPASVPPGFPAAGVRILAGFAGADPAFSPHGLQKFEWDPKARKMREAWANSSVTSANAVPVVSTGSGLVYTVGARDGQWTLEALDWKTGKSAFHWTTGSSRYNTLFSGMNIDQQGRIVHTTPFGIVRYDVPPRSRTR